MTFSARATTPGPGLWAFFEGAGAQEGIIAGVDVGGLLYDGKYRREAGKLVGRCDISIPAGALLANGILVPGATSFTRQFEIPADDLTVPFTVEMPVGGPITVALRPLKTVP